MELQQGKGAFAKLLGEIGTMAKSFMGDEKDGKDGKDGKKDDKKIDAAAKEGADAEAEAAALAAADKDKDNDMGKSFLIPVLDAEGQPVLKDGKPEMMEAVDGTQMMKSIMDRVDGTENDMLKAIGELVNVVKAQGAVITSLKGEVATLAGAGRGRKSVLVLHEKKSATDMSKSLNDGGGEGAGEGKEGIPVAEFMAKALVAQTKGHVTGNEISVAESYLNRGLPIPIGIVSKVLGSEAA